jgi:hypothetical protein
MISRAVEISAGDWTFVVLTSFEKCIAMLTLTLPAIQQGTQLAADAPKDVEFIWKKEEERRLSRKYAQEVSLRAIYSINHHE